MPHPRTPNTIMRTTLVVLVVLVVLPAHLLHAQPTRPAAPDAFYSMLEFKEVSEATADNEFQYFTDARDTGVWEPVPPKVMPGSLASDAPMDAIVLFDGSGLDAWMGNDGGPANWTVEASDGSLSVNSGQGHISTKRSFGSVQLHLEWRANGALTEANPGQTRSNTGIIFQERYQLQLLDCWDNPTFVNGMAGSIYKQQPPLVNACLPPGEWQTLDAIYNAPEFRW